MNGPALQLLVLAGIAIFLFLRLRSVLGTREGFEKPVARENPAAARRTSFEVIDGGPDRDITDHVEEGSNAAKELAQLKRAEPGFGVSDFIQGARGAYEMILMAFERGELEDVKAFLSDEIYESFDSVVQARNDQGLTIEAEFIGVREVALVDANYDEKSDEAEITIRFTGELTVAVRDKGGDIIEGSATDVKRQKDVWTFARIMGSDDPNWKLVATGE